jgi:hypothetical protein
MQTEKNNNNNNNNSSNSNSQRKDKKSLVVCCVVCVCVCVLCVFFFRSLYVGIMVVFRQVETQPVAQTIFADERETDRHRQTQSVTVSHSQSLVGGRATRLRTLGQTTHTAYACCACWVCKARLLHINMGEEWYFRLLALSYESFTFFPTRSPHRRKGGSWPDPPQSNGAHQRRPRGNEGITTPSRVS